MKTLVRFLFFMVCLALCFACSEPDVLLDESPELLKAGKIKVMPSSASIVSDKAEEDWQNINDALQGAEPGEVVQLGAGTFYLHKSIVCWDFNGTLKGAGMGKTIIRSAPDMEFDVSASPPLIWSFAEHDGFFMFCFPHHYNTEMRTVTVSDLKIIVDEPTTPFLRKKNSSKPQEWNCLQAVTVMYENLDKDVTQPIDLNVVYKNIEVIGEKDEGKYLIRPYSLYAGLSAFGASSGSFEAKNIYVENALQGIMPLFFYGENSIVTVKNYKVENAFMGIIANHGHSHVIMNNEFKNCDYCLRLQNSPWNNYDIVLPDGQSFIMNNKFGVAGGVGFAGLDLKNAQVKNNIFMGNAAGFGGIFAKNGDSWIIKNNNFCNLLAPNSILLKAQQSNTTIINNINQKVLDDSVDPSLNVIGEGRDCED